MRAKIPASKSPYYSNAVGGVGFTVGTEATNVINVQLQLRDASSADAGGRCAVYAYLSDDSHGDGIAASAPSGGWAIGTDGLLIPIVTNKAAILVSESDGDIDVSITESTAKTFYLNVVLPDGSLVTSGAITFA